MTDIRSKIDNVKRRIDFNLRETQKFRSKFEEPEYVTPEEKRMILDKLPMIASIDNEIAEYSHKAIRDKLSYMLDLPVNKIVKSAIPELTRIIINTFQRAKAPPGFPVGLLAAQALASQLMQATLNTFHKSGSSKNISSGISGYRDMLTVKDNMQNPSCNIYFKEGVTFDDIIYKQRPKLVQLLIDDIVESSEIHNKEDLYDNTGFKHKFYYMYHSLYKNENKDILNLIQDNNKTGSTFLRVILKVTSMHKNRVTTSDVCNTIEKEKKGKVICVPSPAIMTEKTERKLFMNNNITEYKTIVKKVPVYYIDIFVLTDPVKQELFKEYKEESKPGEEVHNINEPYFNVIILPGFKKMIIKGVTKITNIYPEKVSVWSAVEEEIKDGDRWVLRYHTKLMDKTGITSKHLQNLCEKTGMKVVDEDEYHLIVKIPEPPKDARKTLNVTGNKPLNWKPGRLINYLKLKELDANNMYGDEMRKKREQLIKEKKYGEVEKLMMTKPPTEFELALDFIYAVSDGSNLMDLLRDLDIDETRTISNNIREILYNFGIEAARNFFIEQLYNIVRTNENYIDPRHVMIIAEYITSRGFITPISQKGMTANAISTLTLAGHAFPKKHMKHAAITGKAEKIQGNYSAMITAAPVQLGSTLASVSLNKAEQKRFEKDSKILTKMGIHSDELSDALEKLLQADTSDIIDDEMTLLDPVFQKEDPTTGVILGTTSEVPNVLESYGLSPNMVGASPSRFIETTPLASPSTASIAVANRINQSPVIERDTIRDDIIKPLNTLNTAPLPGIGGQMIGLDTLPEGQLPSQTTVNISMPVYEIESQIPNVLSNIASLVQKKQ